MGLKCIEQCRCQNTDCHNVDMCATNSENEDPDD